MAPPCISPGAPDGVWRESTEEMVLKVSSSEKMCCCNGLRTWRNVAVGSEEIDLLIVVKEGEVVFAQDI